MKFNSKALAIIMIMAVSLIATSVVFAEPTNNNPDLDVQDIQITSQGYSMYDVSCTITPKKSFSYLGIEVTFYDSSNAVIGKSPLVWNMNNPTANEAIKASGTATTDSDSSTPARAEVYIYDSAFGSDPNDAIYHETVNLTG